MAAVAMAIGATGCGQSTPPPMAPSAVPQNASQIKAGQLPDNMPPEIRARAEASRQAALQNELDRARNTASVRTQAKP